MPVGENVPDGNVVPCNRGGGSGKNMKMDERRQKKAVGGYYASVAYMDAQVGKVLDALEEAGIADETIFTSDHGYHLGEHDFWAKVSLHEESAKVPLIVSVPGKTPAVCDSLVELLDLFPISQGYFGFKSASFRRLLRPSAIVFKVSAWLESFARLVN